MFLVCHGRKGTSNGVGSGYKMSHNYYADVSIGVGIATIAATRLLCRGLGVSFYEVVGLIESVLSRL